MADIESLVFIGQNGQAVTTSMIVAEMFEKEHRTVTRSIRELLQSAQNCADYFREGEFEDGRGRKQPMYLMNRDGFTLLAMGFTGPKALEFKLKFLTAFNKMEAMLKSDDYILARSREILESRLQASQQRIQMLEGENEMLAQENKALAPKAQYTDEVLQAPSTYTFSQMAKELNFSGVHTFIAKLKEFKLVYKQSGQYQLAYRFSGQGYTTTRTARFYHSDGTPDCSVSTVWTEKGRKFLHEYFAKKGGSPCQR